MLNGGSKHLLLVAGDEWSKGDTDTENFKTTDHIDVLEDADIIVTCDWHVLDGTWGTMDEYTLSLPAGRYDMAIDEITVSSGTVHIVRA